MITNEMKKVSVISFEDGVDAYGQKRRQGTTARETEMYIKVYTQTATSDIRYTDVSSIGLTKDNEITDANQIIDGNDTYEVLYVIPSSRFNKIMLKLVKNGRN